MRSYIVLALGCILLLAPAQSLAYGDYDDSSDDFWRDVPARAKPKETVDPKTGQRLIGTTFRFFQVRLKPDRTRTQASTESLVAELTDLFVNEGMSHNRVSAAGAHVIIVQTRDEWDEVKDVIFSLPDVYDVTVRDGLKTRPREEKPYSVAWREEMGEGVPEPLQEQAQPPPTARPPIRQSVLKKTRTNKKRRGGKRRSKGEQGSATEL